MATWLEAAKPLYTADLRQPLAFVLGTEATGISEYWVEQADERLIIPMTGQVDSLNVSASAAFALWVAHPSVVLVGLLLIVSGFMLLQFVLCPYAR